MRYITNISITLVLGLGLLIILLWGLSNGTQVVIADHSAEPVEQLNDSPAHYNLSTIETISGNCNISNSVLYLVHCIESDQCIRVEAIPCPITGSLESIYPTFYQDEILTTQIEGITRPNMPRKSSAASIRYVATTGTDDSNCNDSDYPCRTLQYAVDQAANGDEVRVSAGQYTNLNARSGVTQVVYISKSLTLLGGYTLTNWITPDLDNNSSIINALQQGRGIYVADDAMTTIEGVHVTGGNATGLGGLTRFAGDQDWDVGGGMYVVSATVVISNCELFSNTAPIMGGGFFAQYSSVTFVSNTVRSNVVPTTTGWGGGGLMLWHCDNPVINENIIHANYGTSNAGAVFLEYCLDVTISDNDFSYNSAYPDDGDYSRGGALKLYKGTGILSGNIIYSNTAHYAGGLDINSGYYEISDNVISHNRAIDGDATDEFPAWGGGVSMFFVHRTFSRNRVVSNTADIGGGLDIWYREVVFEDNIIAGNTANIAGGGVHLVGEGEYGGNKFNNNLVFSNTAVEKGGGLYFSGNATTHINNVIVDNYSDKGSGVYLIDSFPSLLHNTIARNQGTSGIQVDSYTWSGNFYNSAIRLVNSILVSHTVAISVAGGSSVTVDSVLWDSQTPITISHSPTAVVILRNQYTGDPAFDSDGYHLTSNSAAINKGIEVDVPDDIDGQTRLGSFDLGADEYCLHIFLPLILRLYAIP